jgi:hypothetical protein
MKITHLAAVLVGMSFVPSLVSSRAYALDPRMLFQAEKAAVGGETWRHVAAIRFSGKIIAGDAPGSFTETIDHRNGHSLMVTDTGSLHDESGFDGAIWDKQNGIVTLADLPSLLADAETQAFVNRDGWWSGSDLAEMKRLAAQTEAGSTVDGVAVTPGKGSPVDVWLDRKTHLIVAVNGVSVPDEKLGVFDLDPLRYGTKPFELTIRRGERTFTITIAPGDAD